MPPRDAVSQLPDEIRAELDKRLLASGFSGYEALAEWLTANGFQIGKSSIHRYGEKFEERVSALKVATEQAKAIVAETPDDGDAMSEALFRLVQERLFTILREMEVDPGKVSLGSLTKSIAQLGRASVSQKKWAMEVREKARTAADAAAKIAKKGGLSEGAVDEIRKQILGIGG